MFGFIERFLLDAPVESFTGHTCRHKRIQLVVVRWGDKKGIKKKRAQIVEKQMCERMI